jgi:hypothetical protein
MVRKYKAKSKTGYNRQDLLVLAEEFAKSKETYCEFTLRKNIPRTTVFRWVNKAPSIQRGHKTVLTADEENIIVAALKFLAECNMPFDRDDIKTLVKSFLASSKRASPFKNNNPGMDWMKLFERRHPDISKRQPEILTLARAKNMTPEVVNHFFNTYEKVVSDNSLTAERIFNCDETGLNTDMRSKKVFVVKGKKDVYLKSATGGKTSYSVLVCGSASGKILPPFVVYKGKHVYGQWTQGGPPKAGYACSPSGWMHDTNFESWFRTVFVASVKNMAKPVLLTFDGHNSHLTFVTVKAAMDNKIILLCLPPHTSHRLQPLDVSFFRPFKIIWRDELKNWARSTNYKPVTKPVFPSLLKNAWERITLTSVTGGFKGVIEFFLLIKSWRPSRDEPIWEAKQ